jgi:uncharacterized protein (TIGR03663 family)
MLATAIGRMYHIDHRPMHTDEAVHGVKFIELLEHGFYKYDPHEYHGPTLYYLTLPVALLCGRTTAAELDETTLRIIPLLASLLFFIPLLFLGRILKQGSLVTAALITALSPIIVYYSRYYIHETLLTGFMFMFIGFIWLYLIKHRPGYICAAAVFLGLAIATKETVTLSIAAFSIAAAATLLSESDLRKSCHSFLNRKHLAIGLTALFAVILLFYSSFFTNPSGPADFVKAYIHCFSRAGGQGHQKPWYYYLRLLIYFKERPGFTATEVYIIAAASLTGIAAFSGIIKDQLSRAFTKFLTVYSFALFIIYSLLPYKMPWLALNWMQPMAVIAGIGFAALISKQRPLFVRLIAVALFSAAALHLSYQIYRENGRFMCDSRNPYVYTHTGTDFMRLPAMLDDVAAISPAGGRMPIMVMSDEYWPLPWYLRNFTAVGYRHSTPQQISAPVLVTSIDIATELNPQLETEYTSGIYGLRSGVLLVAFVRNDLWKLYLDRKSLR